MENNQSIIDVIYATFFRAFLGRVSLKQLQVFLQQQSFFFFTLVLIPIQQFVNRYSPSLLSYFRRDRLTISLMAVLISSFFYHITLWFVPPIYLNAYISAFLLPFSFALILLMVFRVIKMMNPSEYLFPRIQEDCVKILKEVKPEELQNPIDKLSQLEDQMKQVFIAGEKVDPNEEMVSVGYCGKTVD